MSVYFKELERQEFVTLADVLFRVTDSCYGPIMYSFFVPENDV